MNVPIAARLTPLCWLLSGSWGTVSVSHLEIFRWPICIPTRSRRPPRLRPPASRGDANFPLANMHPHAKQAAEAAEAAASQGKFWEMHDMIFENQHALEAEDLVGYATALGLDARRFIAELKSHAHA